MKELTNVEVELQLAFVEFQAERKPSNEADYIYELNDLLYCTVQYRIELAWWSACVLKVHHFHKKGPTFSLVFDSIVGWAAKKHPQKGKRVTDL